MHRSVLKVTAICRRRSLVERYRHHGGSEDDERHSIVLKMGQDGFQRMKSGQRFRNYFSGFTDGFASGKPGRHQLMMPRRIASAMAWARFSAPSFRVARFR